MSERACVWRVLACVVLLACEHQPADAIVTGARVDGGPPRAAGDASTHPGAPADGETSCALDPTAARCAASVWPNEHSRANSDPWLSVHHDALRELRPRVLIAHFINGMTVGELRAAAESQIEALGEGSRYHGYDDPSASVFLRHQIVGIVDLTDDPIPADWPYPSSSRLPVDETGAFDVAALFGDAFAAQLGFRDPGASGEALDLCTLFREGHINELWLAVAESGERHPPPMMECKALYDAQGRRVEGAFVPTAGGAAACEWASACGVTVRIAHLNPRRGAGCDLEVRGWAMRESHRAIPYLRENARAFMNADFDERFDVPFERLDDICTPDTSCINYPEPTIAEGRLPDGARFAIDPYEPGCGDPEYPPNARYTWDWNSPATVQTRCAHYGLRDGPDGGDIYELYNKDTVAEATARWGSDCGGGWQIYWRQSIPGLDNRALDHAGQPMKNWWVFTYY